jgi:tripartite-type tricarboxylate transporter receptor subunit TctC
MWLMAVIALALAAACTPPVAHFPSQPLHLIVPFPAGGPADSLARALADPLARELGQPVVVENRSGAAGTLGVEALARSRADGYTLALATTGAVAIAPTLTELPYRVAEDLLPISQLATVPQALAVRSELGLGTLAELVARAGAQPGQLSIGSAGSGGITHVAAELLQQQSGIELVHVPYRGAAPALADLLGGHLDLLFVDISGLLPHVHAGRLRVLALASAQRSAALPELPTTGELGWPGVIADNWYALLGVAGTPPEIVAELHRAARAALAAPQLRSALERQGAEPVGSSPEECAAFIRAETARWGALARASGATWEN